MTTLSEWLDRMMPCRRLARAVTDYPEVMKYLGEQRRRQTSAAAHAQANATQRSQASSQQLRRTTDRVRAASENSLEELALHMHGYDLREKKR